MVSDWQHWKRWRDFVLPWSLDHKNDNKTQNREKQKDKLIKSLSSLGWTDANVKENSVCPWRDETVCGVNNFDPRSSPPYLNQISVFLSLDARIDLKIHKKKSKTFQPKLYITTTLKTHAQAHLTTIPYSSKQCQLYLCFREYLSLKLATQSPFSCVEHDGGVLVCGILSIARETILSYTNSKR